MIDLDHTHLTDEEIELFLEREKLRQAEEAEAERKRIARQNAFRWKGGM